MRQFWGALIGYWIFLISLVAKRNKKKWCFGGDANSKYLFLLGNFAIHDVRAIWFANDKRQIRKFREEGYEAYSKLSLKGLYHLLTSKVYFITHGIGDVNRWTCGNVKIVNLWHGLPYKKIGRDDSKHKTPWTYYILHPTSLMAYDLQLSTSPFVEKFFRRSFKLKNNNFVEALLPRNIVLLEEKGDIMKLLDVLGDAETIQIIKKSQEYSYVYIYMPTFRDDQRDFIKEAGFDFDKLEYCLSQKNILLLLKLHPATASVRLSIFNRYKHIMIVNNEIDVYPILPFTTGLITDYSSIYFDYILMEGKRIIFYTFDYEEYRSKDRDFNFDETYMKGEYCRTFDELLQLLSGDGEFIDYSKIKQIFWNGNKGIQPIIDATVELLKI